MARAIFSVSDLPDNTQVTPLSIIAEQDFDTWQTQQTAEQQQWIAAQSFTQGCLLLPDNKGQLSKAVYVCRHVQDVYACGELSKQLPSGHYQIDNIKDSEQLTYMAFAWGSGAYAFEKYCPAQTSVACLVLDDQQILEQANTWVAAINLTRDLINTPASDMMPQHLAQAANDLARQYGADVSQVTGDELLADNYPMIHAVGRASEHSPRLIDMRWGNPDHPAITLVGKGVCFDSGGLDLKPGNAMRLMKKDMGGAAHVLGLAQLIMAEHLPISLRVLIPAVENAVSGNAFRPGDIIATRKGSWVEIDNTDAEGRLVLCDALTEAVSESPELVIDFATLTGACRVALGTEIPGLFTNTTDIARELMQAGETIDDPVWHLPLHSAYKDTLKSHIADMTNCSATPFGGAITAALYLQHFVDDTPWVHFDVMAWNQRQRPGRPPGGEAMGIRTVFRYLQNRYQA